MYVIMKISKRTLDSLNGRYQYWFSDKYSNEVAIKKATELNIFWLDENEVPNRRTIKALKSEITFDYIMSKINTDKDKIFSDFTKYFNKLIKNEGLSAYPTTYGIGIFSAIGLKSQINEQKNKVEKLLNKLKIKYTTEYSDVGWVFRYKISKSKIKSMLKTKKEKTMFNLKNVSKMKNLKVMMMTLMMCLMTMFIVSCNQNDTSTKNQSQSDNLRQKQIEDSLKVVGQITYSYENEMLVTPQETGVRVEKDMVFSLSSKDYDNIKNSELFSKWEEETFSNPANKEYINKYKDWDKVILYINVLIERSLFDVERKLENGSSLDFIDGSKGIIYLCKDGGIGISYYFKEQNEYGNFIPRHCIYRIPLKDGEKKTDCYIY